MSMIVPSLDLEVFGSKGRKKITALIDTGFTGFLCLPDKLACDLGLELVGVDEVELGDGQFVKQYIFGGQVKFLERTQEVEIILTNSQTAQIGTRLMEDCRLTIDFPESKIRLVRKKA